MRCDDELDRVLAHEQEILPSSGFTGSVMEAVQQEASAPPPIPFPWKRALPGIVAFGLAVLFLAGVTIAALFGGRGARPAALPAEEMSLIRAVRDLGVGWIALALVLSLACVKITSGLGLSRG